MSPVFVKSETFNYESSLSIMKLPAPDSNKMYENFYRTSVQDIWKEKNPKSMITGQ